MMFVYDAADRDIGKELGKKNPDPHVLQNHRQWLKEFGREKVHDQITTVATIRKLCGNMDDFRQKFALQFNKIIAADGIYFCSVASLATASDVALGKRLASR
jgi:hypothetical protein